MAIDDDGFIYIFMYANGGYKPAKYEKVTWNVPDYAKFGEGNVLYFRVGVDKNDYESDSYADILENEVKILQEVKNKQK